MRDVMSDVMGEVKSKKIEKEIYHFDPIHGFSTEPSHRVLNGVNFAEMDPFLRALLVTDGTVTKFLEAYLWEPIAVERLYQRDIILDEDMPELLVEKGDTVIRRKILLRGRLSKRVYAFAESFIKVDLLGESLRNDLLEGRLGIGELLRDRRLETYRELLDFGKEKAGDIVGSSAVKRDEFVVFRSYRILTHGSPLILIVEKFLEARLKVDNRYGLTTNGG